MNGTYTGSKYGSTKGSGGSINVIRKTGLSGITNGLNGLANGGGSSGKMNGAANGAGDINGLHYGKMNGTANGDSNGYINGKTNGATNGATNGDTNGHHYYGKMNGTTNGDLNGGEHYEKVNGATNGATNGDYHGKMNGYTNGDHQEKINGDTNGDTNGDHHDQTNGATNGAGDEEEEDYEDELTEEFLEMFNNDGPSNASMLQALNEIHYEAPKTKTKQEDARERARKASRDLKREQNDTSGGGRRSLKREHIIIKWILKVTHKDKDSSIDFADWIKDGRVLSQVMTTLCFNSVENDPFSNLGCSPEEKRIQQLRTQILDYGVEQKYMFTVDDVFLKKNTPKVIRCLEEVAKLSRQETHIKYDTLLSNKLYT